MNTPSDIIPIHRHIPAASWQQALAEAIRDPAELLHHLQLPLTLLDEIQQAADDFSLCVPRGYLASMEKGNPADPLLRQVLPVGDECRPVAGFHADPVGDGQALSAPGLLHKYHGRVLLLTTAACAVHCRYCFRRHYPYRETGADADWQAAMDYIAQNRDINEVILSGGDPLCLSQSRLQSLGEQISAIAHVSRLRIHSRMPIVLPERIDSPFIEWLDNLPLKVVMVVHCNHPQELSPSVNDALLRLHQAGVILLNQSVLLRGVNDRLETLAQLSEALIRARVMPYYLHLLDRVQGAAHFEVPDAEALTLYRALQKQLPGYLVPRLVREKAGELSKIPVI